MILTGNSTSSSRSSSPVPYHVLSDNNEQTSLEEDVSLLHQCPPLFLSSDVPSNKSNNNRERIVQLLAQNGLLEAFLEGFSSMEAPSDIGDMARRIKAENGVSKQVGESSKSIVSASTNLIDEARPQSNYKTTRLSSNKQPQRSSDALGESDSVSVEIPQNSSITSTDIQLLQEVFNIFLNDDECRSILESKPKIRSLIAILHKLREKRNGNYALWMLITGTGVLPIIIGQVAGDNLRAPFCLFGMCFFAVGACFFGAGINKEVKGGKVIERIKLEMETPLPSLA